MGADDGGGLRSLGEAGRSEFKAVTQRAQSRREFRGGPGEGGWVGVTTRREEDGAGILAEKWGQKNG